MLVNSRKLCDGCVLKRKYLMGEKKNQQTRTIIICFPLLIERYKRSLWNILHLKINVFSIKNTYLWMHKYFCYTSSINILNFKASMVFAKEKIKAFRLQVTLLYKAWSLWITKLCHDWAEVHRSHGVTMASKMTLKWGVLL